MRNKAKIATLYTFLFITLVALLSVGFVQAQVIAPGVKQGMVFVYELTSYWTTSDPSSSIPTELLMINQTTVVEVRISTVNNTHVTVASPWYFKDGTYNIERGAVNLHTGDGYGFVGIIAANLNVGDKIHPNGQDGLKVLDTTKKNYGSSSRATNHVHIVDDDTVNGLKGTRDLYFDKETGILVEQKDKAETTKAPFVTSQVIWKISYVEGVDDWTISDTFPWTTVLLVIIISVSTAVIVIVYNKKIATPKTTN